MDEDDYKRIENAVSRGVYRGTHQAEIQAAEGLDLLLHLFWRYITSPFGIIATLISIAVVTTFPPQERVHDGLVTFGFFLFIWLVYRFVMGIFGR